MWWVVASVDSEPPTSSSDRQSRIKTCLILDNHPIFGGEAKRNEFMVDGYRLIGPQGSNATVVPTGPDHPLDEYHRTLGIPTEFEFQTWDRQKFKPLDFARDHYAFMFWGDRSDSVGYFFDEASEGGPRWATNIWEKGLEDTPYTEAVRRDLLACRASQKKPYSGDDFEAWLDTMTYQHYLENVLGHGPEMAAYMSPILASGLALGSDALSAYRCYAVGAPGFGGFTAQAGRGNTALADHPWFAFPGGNAGLARFFMKWLIPESIQGTKKLNDVVCGRVNFAALDRGGQSVRVRLGATAVRVEHDRSPGTGERVRVTYIVDGKPYTVWARGVVMASASGVNRYVVRDAPAKFQEAWRHFHYASMLVVNVALTNWRFLYKLGITTCRWFNGFGFSANLRRSMIMDDYRPPLDPDKPTVLTLNIPFINPGRPVEEQGQMARLELLSTPYVDYERKLRQELAAMFASAGFDPARDIAGLVLNRWGHAYVVPGPGFHFGRDGKPTAADVVREGYGRIAFGHSELRGHQYWYGGVEEGRRAAKQALKAAFS